MHPYRVVDAFSDQPFRGNPAAVLLLTDSYDDDWAQSVAAEFNLSETAFCRHLTTQGTQTQAARPEAARSQAVQSQAARSEAARSQAVQSEAARSQAARPQAARPQAAQSEAAQIEGAEYDLRWFTPRAEVNLCGHATLATAHALVEEGRRGPFRFRTRSGILTVTPGAAGVLWMDFPANPPSPAEPPPGLREALGAEAVWVGRAGTNDVLVELRDEATVRDLTPNITLLEEISGVRGVMVTAAADGSPYDFVSRFFAPSVGVPEDPVTGSAHTALAPYWSAKLDKTELRAFQCSARGGDLMIRLTSQAPDRVLIGGAAVTTAQGRLLGR